MSGEGAYVAGGATGGELLPCPFCGGGARLWPNPHDNEWAAECDKCSCYQIAPVRSEAVVAWNRRAGAPDTLAVCELVEELLGHLTDNGLGNTETDTLVAAARAAIAKARP